MVRYIICASVLQVVTQTLGLVHVYACSTPCFPHVALIVHRQGQSSG